MIIVYTNKLTSSALTGDGLQQLDIDLGVGRPDVLDVTRTFPGRVHDLDRGRPAGSPHGPDVGQHPHTLEEPALVHTNTTNSQKCHKSGGSTSTITTGHTQPAGTNHPSPA